MTSQNCPECGTRVEPGQAFCDNCGAVLSWTDRAPARTGASATPATSTTSPDSTAPTAPTAPTASTAASSAPAPSSPSPASPRGAAADNDADGDDRGDDDDREDDEDTTETPIPQLPPTTASTSATSATVADGAGASPAAPAMGDTMAERARSLLVPVAEPDEPAPAPPSVAPVLPGVPIADRPQVRAPGPVLGEENGVACPWCATPNRPDRHFCVRCAMPMTLEDRSSVRLPWWRRLFGRGGETPWAGDRPRLRRTFDRIVTWVTAAVVITLLIIAGVKTPDAVQATRDHFAKRAPVAPDRVSASRSYPGHKPDLLFDRLNNTWWGPGVSEGGEGQWIEASFDEPTRLLDVIITSGTSVRPDKLSESTLPHRLKATVTLKDGKTETRELTLDQSAGGQRRAFRVGEVTKVRFAIESSYSPSPDKQVSIAEIEFFGPSSASES